MRFQSCGIYNALDGTEVDAVWDEGSVLEAGDDSEIENEFEADNKTEAE